MHAEKLVSSEFYLDFILVAYSVVTHPHNTLRSILDCI